MINNKNTYPILNGIYTYFKNNEKYKVLDYYKGLLKNYNAGIVILQNISNREKCYIPLSAFNGIIGPNIDAAFTYNGTHE